MSANHNTILINGMGQMPLGRGEPQGYSQPGSGDMTKMAVLTAWKDAGDVVVAEGEAAGSYLAYTDRKTKKSRPALDRFRRTFVWVKGSYILVLDDVRAPEPVTVTWLMQGVDLEPLDEAQGRYRLIAKDATCDLQLIADRPFETEIVTREPSDFQDRYDKTITRRQLRASTDAAAVRLVSVFDPWQRQNLEVALDGGKVTVSGPDFADTWRWKPSAGKFDPTTLHGSRPGGFDVIVDASCAPSEP
jgi:hypothetical protein